jgi:hypothetical protein
MNDMRTGLQLIFLALCLAGATVLAADIKYQNDFQKAELDSFPEELMLIDGNFTVKQQAENKFLELPGAPLDAFSFLFGPNSTEDASVTARIFATSSGRKSPSFEVGLYGVGGYKLRASPAKRMLELYRSDILKTNVPLKWESGKWTHLKLQVVKTGEKWKVQGKCWQEGAQEPSEPAVVFEDTLAPPTGRASAGGMPFAGTPIRFDDLTISGLPPK